MRGRLVSIGGYRTKPVRLHLQSSCPHLLAYMALRSVHQALGARVGIVHVIARRTETSPLSDSGAPCKRKAANFQLTGLSVRPDVRGRSGASPLALMRMQVR